MSAIEGKWAEMSNIRSRQYVCGYCGNMVASDRGYYKGRLRDGSGPSYEFLYICPRCSKPTYFDETNVQTPPESCLKAIRGLPADVESLLREAQGSLSNDLFTCCVLAARKILMHVAVEKGAPENASFTVYVDYLQRNGYIPPDSKKWVDLIRRLGNDANHQIEISTKENAKMIVTFLNGASLICVGDLGWAA